MLNNCLERENDFLDLLQFLIKQLLIPVIKAFIDFVCLKITGLHRKHKGLHRVRDRHIILERLGIRVKVLRVHPRRLITEPFPRTIVEKGSLEIELLPLLQQLQVHLLE